MKSTSIFNKYLDIKEFPEEIIYGGLYSVTWRYGNTLWRKEKCFTLDDVMEYMERYKKYEERYPIQISYLDHLLDEVGIRDRYIEFRRRADFRCLTDLISAQYVTKLINAL